MPEAPPSAATGPDRPGGRGARTPPPPSRPVGRRGVRVPGLLLVPVADGSGASAVDPLRAVFPSPGPAGLDLRLAPPAVVPAGQASETMTDLVRV